MSNKVVICGVNTANLPKLTNKQSQQLLLQIKSGDEVARQQFIISNIRLVLSVVQRYCRRSQVVVDDIFQVGCVGLVKAVDNFNVNVGVRFSTYAVPMIIGEIRRLLRENNSMRISRSIRDLAYQVLLAREELEKTSNDAVRIEDIAKKLNINACDAKFALDSINQPVSIYEPIYSDGDDAILIMDQVKDARCNDDNWNDNITLSQAILQLSQREKSIIKKRYYEGKTQSEVSLEVGLSQAQVSRLEKSAVEQIRRFM